MKPRLIAAALAANLAAVTAAIALTRTFRLSAVAAFPDSSNRGSDTLNNEMELWAKGFELCIRRDNRDRGQKARRRPAGAPRRRFTVRPMSVR